MTIDPEMRTLLIVDDEERLRKAMERSFRQDGYRTRTAASGEDALAVLKTEKVDLVITDLVMPGIDGVALVRTIRSSDPGMKVIVLTAYGSDESMAEAKTLQVAYYLTKPFDLFHLKSRVKRLLKAPGALELACVGQRSKAFCWICSTVGKAVGEAVELPRKTRPYVRPERVVCAAGKVAGAVSGFYLGIWRRFGETR
jgi:two-component system response regulator (stage 0 sporulation protein F)